MPSELQMVDEMFEPCPLIDYKICAFCAHQYGHVYCGVATTENKINENLKICPLPKLKKKKYGQRRGRTKY